ncbi:MAG TPA: protein-glutamate O-methyltransferase CheR [Blastocatellia bacterium]|nr:protein-glutamate O-methyltransferase CheR [Blastocatellia bacterium]
MRESGSGLVIHAGPGAGQLSESEHQLFSELIYQTCGISFGSEKKTFLEARLRKRMEQVGLGSMAEYYQLVKSARGKADEMYHLLDALLIGETSFFRNPPQFDLFSNVVLPELIAHKEKHGIRSLRVWSAGCSTGQEPYTIAMAILEAFPQVADWPLFRIYASDLSFTSLERAQRGHYRPEQMKGVGESCVRKYFHEEHDHYAVNDAVKRHVVFDYHNLKHDNGLLALDVIFCRNVMIYYSREEQQRLVNRFADCLLTGGWLFIGHAESLQGISDRFTMVHQNKGIAWRLDK